MRLGVVGLVPGDIRAISPNHLESAADLGFTGIGFHLPGELLDGIGKVETSRCRSILSRSGMDLAQFSITYRECLFSTDPDVRIRVVRKIERGIEIARQLGADSYLLRPGSLNPDGSWTPHRDNHRPESLDRLMETLRPIAAKLESEGVTAVLETHVVSILDSPETCRSVIEAVGGSHLRLVMDFVNQFESLRQVYDSAGHLGRIFDAVGPLAPVCHIKDIAVRNGLVVHLDETVPGEGELDLTVALSRFHDHHPDGYGLIEHLGVDDIPRAALNVREIAERAGVSIT